ncbi:MAG: QueT transporter family protein [Clostridia bacterium]|nr:QueT transporter family protein [Clostridia bacterium]
MKSKNLKFLTFSAVIAALYAVFTYAAAFFNLAYGPIQFRFSEALNVLCLFTPAAIPGLTVGCLIANIFSFNPIDLIMGTSATLVAAVAMYFLRRVKVGSFPFLSMLMPVVANGVIVGAEIAIFYTEGGASLTGFLVAAAEVAAGEFAVMFTLGTALYYFLLKNPKTLDVDKLK